MYEDYLEEFIFKTAKQIAQKLFGKTADEKDEDAEEEPLLNPSDDSNVNTDEVTEESNVNEEDNEDAKNGATDESEFEILDKQKPSDDTVERTEGTDVGGESNVVVCPMNVSRKTRLPCRSRNGEEP